MKTLTASCEQCGATILLVRGQGQEWIGNCTECGHGEAFVNRGSQTDHVDICQEALDELMRPIKLSRNP